MVQRRRWSRGSVLAFDTEVRGFEPGRSTPSFEKGSKAVCPMSQISKESVEVATFG